MYENKRADTQATFPLRFLNTALITQLSELPGRNYFQYFVLYHI